MTDKTSTFEAKNITPSTENLAAQIAAMTVRLDAQNDARLETAEAVKRQFDTAHIALIDRIDRDSSALAAKFDASITSLREMIQERQVAHEAEHKLNDKALLVAQERMADWQAGSNEWRAESRDKTDTFPTKAELTQIVSRLDGMVERNFSEIKQMIVGKDGLSDRIRSIEDFKLSVNSQIGGLRNLLALAVVLITIISFAIARFGH